MWATYWDALQEVGGRRVLLSLFGLGLVIGFLINRPFRFDTINGVDVIYQGPVNMGPWPLSVPATLAQISGFTGMFWIVLWLIAGGPLFVLTLERGWRELTFSKGTPRWQILLGRYLATTTLFVVIVLMTNAPLAARLWWHTGVSTWHIVIAVLIQAFSFTSLLAVAALASTTGEGGVTMPIVAPLGVIGLSGLLYNRSGLYPDYITSELARRALDFLYTIFPKCMELDRTAAAFIQSSSIPTSWPVWTTGLFTLATLAFAGWVLERRSF
jgi:hypothetical protein